MEDYFKIGIITGSHGVRGEMKIYPTTDDPNRFKKCRTVFLEGLKGLSECEVESVRVLSSDKVLLKLKGIDTPEEIIKYRQKGIFVDREHAVKLHKNEYFIADIIGLKVLDESGKELGEITDVLPTGANDVYEIKTPDGREFLVPAIKECILNVDMEAGTMSIHVMPGLLD